MQLRFQEWLPDLLGLQSIAQSGVQQVHPQSTHGSPIDCAAFFAPIPKGFEDTSLIVLRDNLAAISVDWSSSSISKPWLLVESYDSFAACVTRLRDTSFIAFDEDLLGFIGRDAKLETVHEFSGSDAQHVHEAPVYLPTTHELLFADTSVVGWLWALEVNSYQTRKVNTNPPLENVNGATMHDSRIYLTTNGGRSPGIWNCSVPCGLSKHGAAAADEHNDQHETKADVETISCTVVVNNYRFHHLNSPNDLIFTSSGNIIFTDPTYGWAQSWPGVGPPELPTTTYYFNTQSRALVALDNNQILQPNGLALSSDERTLYVADSNSTSGKPIGIWEESVRNVYAFDFEETSLTLKNRRLVHVVESGWPDGLRVTKTGEDMESKELVLVASMGGVDVVDVSRGGAGVLLGKCNVGDDIIFNLEPALTADYRGAPASAASTWFLTGRKGVYKLTISP